MSAGESPVEPLVLMADYAPVMIWLAITGRGCVYVNRMWLEFTGRPLQAELGSGWSEALHPGDRTRVLELYERAFRERTSFEVRFRLRRFDGTWRWLAHKGAPLPQESGFQGFVGSCVDITDRIAAEESRAQEDARRDEFLAIVSHELRSPLNGIKSWTHVLENLLPDAQPPVCRALAGIMIGVDHQVRLIDELLDPLAGTDVAASVDALHWQKGISMTDRKSATPPKVDSHKLPEHTPDPDTLEGPGGRHEAEGESDARDKVTRRGEV